MQELLRQCFVQFRCQLVEEKRIDQQAIFIDGTKIEANANKFTFRYSSEANYENVLTERVRTPLITYGIYRKEQKKKYKSAHSK